MAVRAWVSGRLAASIAAAVAVLASGAATAGAQTVLSQEPSAPKVSAAGGVLAWSSYDAATSTWALMLRRDGVTERAPVAPRPVPFDVDLGRDAAGRLVASYSRCRTAAPDSAAKGRGCDLYIYDLDARTERKLGGASTPDASEYLPTLAGGRVAFARVYEGRSGAAGRHSYLYVRSLSGGSSRQLPGGTMNDDARTGPTALDLDTRRLAFEWEAVGPAGPGYDYGTSEMRIDYLDGGRTIVELAAHGGISRVGFLGATLLDGVLYYGRNYLGDGDGPSQHQFRSYTQGNGALGAAQAEFRLEGGTATDAAQMIYGHCIEPDGQAGPPGCDVMARGPVPYADPSPPLASAARPTTASAYRGAVAFSAYDATTDRYRLMLRRRDGSIETLPVASRTVPFDVDLGPGPNGELTAAYSRCATEPRTESFDRMTLPWTGRGCDLYRYDTTTRRESKIGGASTSASSEFLPSIWGDEVAFARVYEQRPGRDGRLPYLYVRPLSGGDSTRLPGGPRGTDGGPGPRAIDEYGARTAFVWDSRTDSKHYLSELRLDTQDGGHDIPDSATSADGSARELSPSFEQGVLSWVRRAAPGPLSESVVVRYDLRDGATRVYSTPDPTTTYINSRYIVTSLIAYGTLQNGAWTLREPAWTPRFLP
jgi:hypothetical protein